MNKIMFNDRYGLMGAVLRGDKTMTRRIVPIDLYNQTDWKAVSEGDFEAVVDGEGYYHDIRNCGKYRVGEEGLGRWRRRQHPDGRQRRRQRRYDWRGAGGINEW